MKKAYIHDTTNQIPIPEEFNQCAIDFSMVNDIPDASCLEMFVSATMFDEQQLLNILKKIRRSGKITITGPDLYEISRNVLIAYLSEKDVRSLIKPQEKLYTCIELGFLLEQYKFKVTQKRVNHNRFYITAERQ